MPALSAAGSGLLFLAGVCHAQSAPQPSYRAPWVAMPNAAPVTVTVQEKQWAPAISFRPARTLVLENPAVEQGKRGAQLVAGTLMVAMDDAARIVCEFERPKGRYFIGCVEDYDGDGRHEGFFLLNHANPYLFSAMRQPRHQKHRRIDPVTLRSVADKPASAVSMVFIFQNRSELVGVSQYQLCVMRDAVQNIWGDKSVARVCLPALSIKDGAEPRTIVLYGRTFRFASPVAGTATLTVSAQPNPIPAEL